MDRIFRPAPTQQPMGANQRPFKGGSRAVWVVPSLKLLSPPKTATQGGVLLVVLMLTIVSHESYSGYWRFTTSSR
jgi:hypothetical protein